MAPSTSFCKIWCMCNSGSTAWPFWTQLTWIGGDQFARQSSVKLEISQFGFPVGGETDVCVDLVVPAKPGRYILYWRLASPDIRKFGQRVWVLIQKAPVITLEIDSGLSTMLVGYSYSGREDDSGGLQDGSQEAASCLELARITRITRRKASSRHYPGCVFQPGSVDGYITNGSIVNGLVGLPGRQCPMRHLRAWSRCGRQGSCGGRGGCRHECLLDSTLHDYLGQVRDGHLAQVRQQTSRREPSGRRAGRDGATPAGALQRHAERQRFGRPSFNSTAGAAPVISHRWVWSRAPPDGSPAPPLNRDACGEEGDGVQRWRRARTVWEDGRE